MVFLHPQTESLEQTKPWHYHKKRQALSNNKASMANNMEKKCKKKALYSKQNKKSEKLHHSQLALVSKQ